MSKKLQVGKSYKTRAGHTANVITELAQQGPSLAGNYPFYSEIFDADGRFNRTAYFSPHGRYNTDSESQFDLVIES